MKRKKVLKISVLIFMLVLIWGLIWASSITRIVKKNSKNNAMKNRHAIVKNIIVTETKDEKKYWEFYAKSGEYDSNNNSIQLNDVIGNFYGKDDEVILSFQSTKGNYDEKTKKVVLNGDNLFVGKNGSQLYADELIWQGKDKDILANGNVQFIMENKIVSKAQNAEFNSTLTDFKIKNNAITKIYSENKEEEKKKYTLF